MKVKKVTKRTDAFAAKVGLALRTCHSRCSANSENVSHAWEGCREEALRNSPHAGMHDAAGAKLQGRKKPANQIALPILKGTIPDRL